VGNKPYLIDVPVRVNIWIRPECQRKQFEVLKQARPSIMFLQSDGGRNDNEWEAIFENRKIFDEEVDWDCTIYKFYEDHNNGIYTMGRKVSEAIWNKVDRCIFLEDDYVPAVSFFRFCAELLEEYKDDERIEMICGNNVFGTYPDAEPYDYFFTENGWSIWGIATWKRTIDREYPLEYANNEYIKRCLKANVTEFWYKKVDGYCKGELVDNHVPGGEYFHAINSALFHRLSIVPTRNMIKNIGTVGAHVDYSGIKAENIPSYFYLPTYEIEFPIKHPKYVIDDKVFGMKYEELLGHGMKKSKQIKRRLKHWGSLIINGQLFKAIKRKMKKKEIER
jgi:hypothetical protein